jgi:prophage regulatory protein
MERLLTLREIVGDKERGTPGILNIGVTTWYRGIQEGRFPQPVRGLGQRLSRWRLSEVMALVECPGQEEQPAARVPRQL